MKTFAPSYYPAFSCIAGDCRHSCCIGWEIDIDDATCAYYRALPGALGDRLRRSIRTEDGISSFVLGGEEERCPFLNGEGLCDLILTLGEDALCQICTDHPRFYTEFSDHTEVGLGLACEAAAKLILTWEEPVSLTELSDDGEDTPSFDAAEEALLSLRAQIFALLQNRQQPTEARITAISVLCGASEEPIDLPTCRDFLLDLETLDPAWRARLAAVSEASANAALPPLFAEQLLYSLVYRHLPNMRDGISAGVIWRFCVLAYRTVAGLYCASDTKTVDTLCDLVRMFSSEIEYAEENTAAIFDAIADGKL